MTSQDFLVRTVAAGKVLLAPSVTLRLTDEPRQMARGRSNAEAARTLSLSEATVKTHVAAILAATGSRDRLQAVVLAHESGIVRPGR